MLQKALIGIILNGAALYAVTYFLEGVTYTGGVAFFVLGGAIMGLLNFVIKPILKAAAFPIVFLTAGIFLVVINTFLLWVTKVAIDVVAVRNITMQINGITTYLIAGFLFGIANWIEHLFIKNR